MFQDHRVLAVVPARGGSKTIPLKNLVQVGGHSLIELVSIVLHNIDCVDRAIVSTDHAEIRKVALDCGLSVPFMRPASISGDFVSDVEVLKHSLFEVEQLDGEQYSMIIMLQPTSPFRRAEHVLEAMKLLVERQYDSVVTLSVTDTKYHPLKQLNVDDNLVSFYDPHGPNIIARQQLKSTYHRNGVAYVMTRECLTEQNKHIGKICGGYIIDEPLVNIDTYSDLEYAENLLLQRR